jgi:hypothetical protein
MPKNKDDLLLRYREICTRVMAVITYWTDDDELVVGVAVAVTIGAATTAAVTAGAAIAATTVDVGVCVGGVALTGVVLWSPTRPPAADETRPPAAAARNSAARARPEGISPFHWLGIAYRYYYF